jgi:hypothetical protein
MDSIDHLIDYPISVVPLPEEYLGYRPVTYYNSQNCHLTENDILLVFNEQKLTYSIVSKIAFYDNFTIKGVCIYNKKVEYTDYYNQQKVQVLNHSISAIKKILISKSSEWIADFDLSLIEIGVQESKNIIILQKVTKDLIERYFPNTCILKRGTVIYKTIEAMLPIRKNEEFKCLLEFFTDQTISFTDISNDYTSLNILEDMKLLDLSKGNSQTINDYYRYIRLILGFSLIGPIPLEIAVSLPRIIAKISRDSGIENGLVFGQNFLLFKSKLSKQINT